MDGTFKVYLTAEQWERVCVNDEEICAEVAKQQPVLFESFEGAQSKERHSDVSPVADKNVGEAVEQINGMRSKDKLQDVIDNDPRVTVQEAARKRLESIE